MVKGKVMRAVVIALSLALIGAVSVSAQKKPLVGLVMKSLANDYFKAMEEGARKFATKDGSFLLVSVGMNSETDMDTQINAMDNFIAQKLDLIVIAPADSVGMIPSIKKAIKAGIKVVNIDVKLDTAALKAAGLPADFLFVGPDNAVGTEMVGNVLAKKLGKGGKVVILEGNPGADNATQRTNGFKTAIANNGLVLLDSKTAHWETEEANTVLTNLITKYPDIQGVMCDNDSMVLGAVKAIEAAGKTGQIQVVGFDNIPAVQDLIKKGAVLATVDQFGPQQAQFGIEAGMKLLKGQKVSGWLKTDVKVIDAAALK
jgi:ribose transport system substrate-binding protein